MTRWVCWLLMIIAGGSSLRASEPTSTHRSPLGGVWVPPAGHACVTPAQRSAIFASAEETARALGLPDAPFAPRGPMLYQFYPHAGTLWSDLDAGLFVDLDAGAGFHDFLCGNRSYDGHRGIDSGLRSFEEQGIGVPVFAVLDGVVVARSDGFPDMNTAPDGNPGNYVGIDHGSGRRTWYFHLRANSGLPAIGRAVVAGEPIGLTGSSGNSFGPHLHFESDQGGAAYEPFAGACRPGASGFAQQPVVPSDVVAADCGWSRVSLAPGPPLPAPQPRTGQLAFGEDHWFWISLRSVPAGSTFRLRYIRPDASVAFEASEFPLGNPEFYASAWYWFNGYFIPEMHSVAGAWRMQVDINGRTLVDAPVTVNPVRVPGLNRSPAAPVGLAMEPDPLDPGRELTCRVLGDDLLDDPDYDVVRYRYAWRVNGVAVRDEWSAGRSDTLARGMAGPGSVVACDVTASDGSLDAPSVTISRRMPGGCVADIDDGTGSITPDGGVTIDDLLAYLALFDAGDALADCDDGGGSNTPDGGVTIEDLLYFLVRFDQGC